MTIKKTGFIVLGAILLIGLSLGLSWVYIQSKLKLTTVYIASEPLEGRTRIEEAHLKAIRVPKEYLDSAIVLDKEEILNRYVSLQGWIPKGSYFYASMLDTLDASRDAPTLRLYEDQAIYALDVSLTMTAGNTLLVNQKVDVYGTLKNNKELIADRLLSQVRIVGLKDKNGNDITEKSTNLPKVLLLAVYRDFIPWLAKLEALGTISLSPTAYQSTQEECIAETQTDLWNLLYDE